MTYNFNPTIDAYIRDRSRMYFLVKDYRWTFIWWHITSDEIETARMELTEKVCFPLFVLRIYDVTDIIFNGDNAHGFIDVEVLGPTDNWYLNVPESGRNYVAEAGFREPGGRFVPVVRSNAVFVPPDHGRCEAEEWKRVEWKG